MVAQDENGGKLFNVGDLAELRNACLQRGRDPDVADCNAEPEGGRMRRLI